MVRPNYLGGAGISSYRPYRCTSHSKPCGWYWYAGRTSALIFRTAVHPTYGCRSYLCSHGFGGHSSACRSY